MLFLVQFNKFLFLFLLLLFQGCAVSQRRNKKSEIERKKRILYTYSIICIGCWRNHGGLESVTIGRDWTRWNTTLYTFFPYASHLIFPTFSFSFFFPLFTLLLSVVVAWTDSLFCGGPAAFKPATTTSNNKRNNATTAANKLPSLSELLPLGDRKRERKRDFSIVLMVLQWDDERFNSIKADSKMIIDPRFPRQK